MRIYCKGKTMASSAMMHVVTFGNRVIVVRNVPCEECGRCGEKHFSDEVMEKLDLIVAKAKGIASKVLVTDYNGKAT